MTEGNGDRARPPSTDQFGPRPGARRYAVVGVGAIGGYYGARLAAAGHELHAVARSDAAHLRRRGLRVESVDGDLLLPAGSFTVHEDPSSVPPVDVVLLAVKTTVPPAARAELVRPLAGPGTVVVALQNGLGVEEPLAAVADGPVLGGMCFVCAHKVGPGHVRHLDFGTVTLGEHRPAGGAAGVTAAVEAVAADLEGAGVGTRRLGDLPAGRWRKLVWNVPFNGLSVVLDAGTDELMGDPATVDLVRAIMLEVIGAAGACGHRVDESFADEMLAATAGMTPYRTSMKLDHDAGRALEIDAIYGAPLAAGETAGFAMPRTGALAAQLRFVDRRTRGHRPPPLADRPLTDRPVTDRPFTAGRGTRPAMPG